MTKLYELLKCDLTDSEIAESARELARANARCASIEQQKKEVDSQLKAEIEAQKTVINRLSGLINTGSEYRNIEVRVELDTPESGKKTIVRLDTGEVVNIKPMTEADRQMVLDLQTRAEAEEAARQPATEPIITQPPYVQRIDAPGAVEAKLLPGEAVDMSSDAKRSISLAQAAMMGGTHQRKNRKPGDAKREAAADGSGDGLD